MVRPLFSSDEWNQIVHALGLSSRKAQIAALVLEGLNDDTIAKALGIRKSTLRTHLRQMFERLRVTGRMGLAVAIFRTSRRLQARPLDHHQ